MIRQKTITLKKANKVFPEKFTRVRPHDLVSALIKKKKFLTEKEQERLQSIADEVRESLFKRNQDILIIRKGKKLTLKPF